MHWLLFPLMALAPEPSLETTILTLDREMFRSASFDECSPAKFQAFFSEDVEFYHDQGGVTRGNKTLTEQVVKNLCGVVRRELIPGTTHVSEMKGYGAVQTGSHRFYQPKQGSKPLGQARFLHLWKNEGGTWRITRVISYDHVALPN